MLEIDWSETEALLEKNISYINNSSRIHADINKLRHIDTENYRVSVSADGKGFVIEKKTDSGFIRLNSAHEPFREGKLLAEKLTMPESTGKVYFFIGLGFGCFCQ